MVGWLVVVSMVLAIGGCATGPENDQGCSDYEPLDFCDDDSEYVCQTTEGGCRQCTCLPEEEAARFKGYGP